jgi:hypothetical protein
MGVTFHLRIRNLVQSKKHCVQISSVKVLSTSMEFSPIRAPLRLLLVFPDPQISVRQNFRQMVSINQWVRHY